MDKYKIFIDSAGVIKAILLPEEPKEENYVMTTGSDLPSEEDFGGLAKYRLDVENYKVTLSKAKLEAVPFKGAGGNKIKIIRISQRRVKYCI